MIWRKQESNKIEFLFTAVELVRPVEAVVFAVADGVTTETQTPVTLGSLRIIAFCQEKRESD